MLTELLAGLWIGNHEDAYNNEFYKDNLITIAINCTIDKSFCNIQNVKNVRIPISNQTTTEDILHLQTNMEKILAFIHGNIEDNNFILTLIFKHRALAYGEITTDKILKIMIDN